ncbi:MAG TPA: hypothetical protein PLS41_05520 [Bacteroidales bacterium]|nr:hypothetical protein [Bacteroidales bacterium]
MKNVIFLTALLALGVFGSIRAQSDEARRFAIKSGHIEYKLTGSTEGIKSVWFDHYGDTYVEELQATTTVKMLGMKSVEEIHSLTIQQGAIVYTLDLASGTGQKTVNPYYTDGHALVESMTAKEQEEFANDLMTSLGGEITGQESILGKTCDVMQVLGSRSWIYKGVTLKSDTKVLGIRNLEEAVSFEENVRIPASLLEPPSHIEIHDLTENAVYEETMGSEYESASEEEWEEEEIIPVKMPFETFKKGVAGVMPDGFSNVSEVSLEGQHMAVYRKTITESFTVIASAMEGADVDSEEMEAFESFRENGKKMHYSASVEEGMPVSVLIIEYPGYETYITLAASFGLSKNEMLKLAGKLNF